MLGGSGAARTPSCLAIERGGCRVHEHHPIARSRLPSVHAVLRTSVAIAAAARFGHAATVNAIRKVLEEARERPRAGGVAADAGALGLAAMQVLAQEDTPTLRPVFNLTGTVL